MPSIVDLPDKVSKLPDGKKNLVNRFFIIDSYVGKLKVPKDMKAWINKQFKSVSNVTSQKIIRVENHFTGESSIFNDLRAKRPLPKATLDVKEIEKSKGGPFSKAKKLTPEDTFGRVKGKHSVTASNVAKYDKWHGLIVFDKHNPLKVSQKEVIDYIEVAKKWFNKAHKQDKQAKFPFILWNCLWKGGASITHGHMQLLLPRKRHYPAINSLNQVRNAYKKVYGTDYFEDLYKVHEYLGLGLKKGSVKIIVNLTAKKEKEIIILAPTLSKEFSKALYQVVESLKKLGVESFTMGIGCPPLTKEKEWKGFPVIARVMDRGPLNLKTSDMGGIEIYGGAAVVASDPYVVRRKIN